MTKKLGRRIAMAVLALGIGFGASWIAFSASDTASVDGERGELLGRLDFATLCRREYGESSEAVPTRLDAYGWKCAYTVNRLYQMEEIDIDTACHVLYDGPTYATSYDLTDTNSWECFRGPAP